MEEIKNEMNEMIPEKKKGNSNVALWIGCCLSLICSLVLMCVVFCDGNEEKEDVKAVAVEVLRHRIVRNYYAEAEGISTDAIIKKLLAE